MLQDLRERFIGTTGKVVLAVILLLLAGTGLNYTLTPKQFAAKINGEEIPVQEFDREYQALLSRFGDQQIPEFYLEQLRQQSIEQVFQNRTVQSYLDDAGFAISDEQLRDFLQTVPTFQVDGAFDPETYRLVLANNQLSPAAYEQGLRAALASRQYVGSMLETEFVTPTELREFVELRDEQREVEYAVISPEAFVEEVSITDADVTNYFESNPELYQTPEMVDIDYLIVDRDAAASTISVDDAALAEFFESVAGEYVAPEERRVRQILLTANESAADSKTLAEALRGRLLAGEEFEALVEEFSVDSGSARQGGDLGWVRPGDFVGPVEEAVFSLQVGEVSEVVQSEFGLHILRVDEVRGGGEATLADVRDDVETRYRESLIADTLFDLQGRVSDLEFEGADIESIASAVGLSLQSFEGFHPRRQQPFGSVAEIGDALFGEGASDSDGQARLVQYGDNTAVLRVKARTPAGRQPIENVSNQIRELLTQEAAQAVADERGAQLAGVLATQPLIAFDALTLNTKATANDKRLVSRTDSDVPAALAAAIFAAPAPSSAGQPYVGNVAAPGAGFVIYRLTQVLPGDPSAIPQAQLEATRSQIAQQRARQQVDALVQGLRDSADVEIGPILQRSDTP